MSRIQYAGDIVQISAVVRLRKSELFRRALVTLWMAVGSPCLENILDEFGEFLQDLRVSEGRAASARSEKGMDWAYDSSSF